MHSPVFVIACHGLTSVKFTSRFLAIGEYDLGVVTCLELSIIDHFKEILELATPTKVPIVVHVEDWKLGITLEVDVVFLLREDLLVGRD